MISFKTFLQEKDLDLVPFLHLCDRISSECGQFLKESQGKPLYRGARVVAGNSQIPLELPHPKGRSPKDSNPGFNLFYNAGMQMIMGIPEIRKQIVYATGATKLAKSFGFLYFFFPKDGYKFLYAGSINDSYVDSDGIYISLSNALTDAGCPINRYHTEQMFDHLVSLGITPADIAANSVETRNKLNAYYTSEYEDEYSEGGKLGEVLAKCLKDTFEALNYKTTDLHKAITSLNEVGFYESDGYYMLPLDSVRKHFPDEELPLGADVYERLLTLL